ncbi:hypothetical protein GUITHDRAFT_145453 [Guillardia theta CCMP2712]|uniref:Uncharacterized protein n=1 Tax=Guillardia theta (strain CCMP2712) TaxID=905079 RepID=L1IKQ8_GUITC|nr:hypothetical protein GUITHDRAFT_145453 [Guillardia theta CCMP2712]EKX36828.1 hypothetical protein GUITHDRAFT_145453 [Guillardia theta CCMP2712]|eukprot:XP_005823808.1 hypothetical protein GUITHDRAFT_145453 [Guillardia theta CCMP2712]
MRNFDPIASLPIRAPPSDTKRRYSLNPRDEIMRKYEDSEQAAKIQQSRASMLKSELEIYDMERCISWSDSFTLRNNDAAREALFLPSCNPDQEIASLQDCLNDCEDSLNSTPGLKSIDRSGNLMLCGDRGDINRDLISPFGPSIDHIGNFRTKITQI